MSRRIIAGFGLLVLGLGLYVLVSPGALPQFADNFLSPTGVWVAAGFRLTLGIVLWMAADASRTPRVFRFLGVLFVLGGLAIPVIGLARLEAMATWGMDQPDLLLRGMGFMVTALGAFLFWATRSRKAQG